MYVYYTCIHFFVALFLSTQPPFPQQWGFGSSPPTMGSGVSRIGKRIEVATRTSTRTKAGPHAVVE
eukprot:3642900-Heterocapsa_arctica.AAC.1